MNTNAELLKSLKIDRSAPPPPPSRKPLWIALGVLALLAVLVLGGWLFFARDGGIEVRTAAVQSMGGSNGAASVLDASGYVVARRMATVSAKITGRVREVLIEEGQRVEAGQVMATLDPIDADAQRDLTASQLAAARSQATSVQARLKEAEANAARLQRLVGQQLVSKAQYDQAIAQRDALRAELLTARRNAQVASDSLRIADIGVDNTVVRAPFDGVVVAKAAQPGEIVSPLSAGGGFTRTGIGTVVDMDSLEVEVEVNEAFIGRVQPKMPLQATLNAYPDWQIPGSVIAIIPTADRSKATVKVRVALDRKDPRIVPDMGVRVSFMERQQPQQAQRPAGVRVPGASVVKRDGADVAFAVTGDDSDRAELRQLKLGRTLGDDREVLSGLAAGDEVVLDPPAELQDGGKLKVQDDAEAAG